MSKTLRIRFWSGMAVLSVALALLVASLLANQSHPDTESTARDLGRRVEARLALLDRYAAEALTSDPDAWLRLEDLPEDMVVYRYREDTLLSWTHQFPIRNDDIRSRTYVQRLGDDIAHRHARVQARVWILENHLHLFADRFEFLFRHVQDIPVVKIYFS